MAYLDDNNDNLYSKGDPLEELDSELAELKATLGTLDDGQITEAPVVAPKAQEPERDDTPADKPDESSEIYDTADDKGEEMKKYTEKPVPAKHSGGKGKSKKSAIIAAVIIAAAIIIGSAAAIGFGVLHIFDQNDNGDNKATSGGEVVTINDSVMGNIELQTVKGAEINTYTEDNLVIDENGIAAYYEDGKKISHLGIDLSEYQGEVDFAKAKAAGVEFVMLRIGGRYYGDDGGLYADDAFDSYYEQAKAAGLKVGAYFFSQAVSAEDAVEEARFALDKLGGKKLDYPIAFDWENIAQDDARTDGITGEELTLIAEAFCDTIIDSGYKAIVYSNTQQMFVMYDFETMKDYDFWLADYRDFPNMYYSFDMWQYATDGTIDGIDGSVDLNISFTDFT